MSKRRFIFLALILLLTAWLGIEVVVNRHWLRPSPRADVRIEVTGVPGAKIAASFEIDGIASERSGTLPISYSFQQARHVKFTIAREAGPGELWAKVFVNEAPKGRLGGAAEWLRGSIERGSMDSTCGQGQASGLW